MTIEREQRYEKTHHNRPEKESDWPEKREAAEYREEHEERMEIHAGAHELRPEYVVDKPNGNNAPNRKTHRRSHRSDRHEIDNGGGGDEPRTGGGDGGEGG